jgi:hypothetical protein
MINFLLKFLNLILSYRGHDSMQWLIDSSPRFTSLIPRNHTCNSAILDDSQADWHFVSRVTRQSSRRHDVAHNEYENPGKVAVFAP